MKNLNKKKDSMIGFLTKTVTLCALVILSLMVFEKDVMNYPKNAIAAESDFRSDDGTISHQQADIENLIMVETEHMDFQMPDEILSGWTTFRYKNNSQHTHFFLLEKMPEVDGVQKDIDDYFDEVVPAFGKGMALINQGKTDEGIDTLVSNLPAWSFSREYIGGVGLLGPGQTGETTQYLEPGLYVLECYVKTGGVFHTSLGMARQVIVKEEESNVKPPESTLQLNVNMNGYELTGNPQPGENIMEVYFEEQAPPATYSNFVGHDVNLVRIDNEASMGDINHWMNWVNIEGLNTPAPASTMFLGGVQEMPTGNTAYVTFTLEAEQTYGIVAEVPDPISKGFFTTFSVTQEE